MKTNCLTVVCGLPCVGKSTIAYGIAKKLQIPVFSVDPIESAIIASGIKRCFETGYAAYLIAKELANENLDQGLSVIIDAVSAVKEAKELWRELAKKYKLPLIIIECELAENIHQTRVEKRYRNIRGIDEVSWNDVKKARTEYVPWAEKKLTIDTAEDQEINLAKSLDYINTVKRKK